LYALSPQLKSLSSTPEVRLAAQLNNLEGKFLETTESKRFFYHQM
jgi:hypothetical protein